MLKARTKIIEVFNNELEHYNAIMQSKDEEVDDALAEIERREYMLTEMKGLEPKFKAKIEKEFISMKKEIKRLLQLLH